jgi:hypothetical protein
MRTVSLGLSPVQFLLQSLKSVVADAFLPAQHGKALSFRRKRLASHKENPVTPEAAAPGSVTAVSRAL